jgi:hypothetical protein
VVTGHRDPRTDPYKRHFRPPWHMKCDTRKHSLGSSLYLREDEQAELVDAFARLKQLVKREGSLSHTCASLRTSESSLDEGLTAKESAKFRNVRKLDKTSSIMIVRNRLPVVWVDRHRVRPPPWDVGWATRASACLLELLAAARCSCCGDMAYWLRQLPRTRTPPQGIRANITCDAAAQRKGVVFSNLTPQGPGPLKQRCTASAPSRNRKPKPGGRVAIQSKGYSNRQRKSKLSSPAGWPFRRYCG